MSCRRRRGGEEEVRQGQVGERGQEGDRKETGRTTGQDYAASLSHRVLEDVIVHVEVGRVGGRGHVGDVRRLGRADVVPVDAAKERVALEVRDPVEAQTAFPGTQQPLDQVLGVLRDVGHVGRELETLLEPTGKKGEQEGKWSEDRTDGFNESRTPASVHRGTDQI